MSKGRVRDFQRLYAAILKDISMYYPDDQADWDMDKIHLSSLVDSRGLSVFTMDLPALGKILDKCLSSGSLVFHGEPLSRSSKRSSMVPRLFRGLWRRIIDDNGCLLLDVDPNTVVFLRTLLYASKKWDSACDPSYLYKEMRDYHETEASLPQPDPFWDSSGSDLDTVNLGTFGDMVDRPGNQQGLLFGADRVDAELLDSIQRVADQVSTALGIFDPHHARFRHGPGAVSDLRRGEYKYSFPTWSDRLEPLFPSSIFANANVRMGRDVHISNQEMSSVHIAVRKTMKGPRLIAKEPTCHQWCQQSIADFLQQGVKTGPLRFSIDFRRQSWSRSAALEGSRTGLLATIDLKSASDRLTTHVVQRMFRRNPGLLGHMVACRTRYLSNGIDKKLPSLIKLRKFSTQGSALTFPVQSYVFATICIGVGIYYHNYKKSRDQIARQVRVFGDDIIVPKEWVPLVRKALSLLYLRVNDTKTHTDGYFRESCGMDAWRGYDVTPPYITKLYQESRPSSLAATIDVANNFFLKGFWHTADVVMSTVPSWIRKSKIAVVARQSRVLGLISNTGSCFSNLSSRWNSDLQVREYRAIGVLTSNGSAIRNEGPENLLQFFTEKEFPTSILRKESEWETGVAPDPVSRKGYRWVHE